MTNPKKIGVIIAVLFGSVGGYILYLRHNARHSPALEMKRMAQLEIILKHASFTD